MLEKQKLEALRQLEVSKAIERLLEEDKQRRQSTRDRLQNRMREAEIRKRRREQDYWRVCIISTFFAMAGFYMHRHSAYLPLH